MSSVIVTHPATELCVLVKKPAQPTAQQVLRAHRVQTWGWKEKIRFYLFG